ncbi:MAG TPA: Rap1a/Tai family immunity protein [Patescibacteria group bacterium]|nr:Rap1a/Tai family immunity protein [Patescibacteria group bacterium]
MKSLLPALLFLAMSAVPSGIAQAQYYATKDLAAECLSAKREEMASCIGYVAGVIDYHLLMQSFGTAPTIDFCLPQDISKEQAAVIVMAYLRGATEHDEFTAAATIPLALNKVFPCRPAAKTRKKKRS